MKEKKNQLEQVTDVLKGMFNEKELAMMEAQYQKMMKEWEEKKKASTTKDES
jgi:hypothetical protein